PATEPRRYAMFFSYIQFYHICMVERALLLWLPDLEGPGPCRRHGRRERAHRALEFAALSSCDDSKNGQKTPCLRTARTYAILTAPAAGWFFKRATVRQPESTENHCINVSGLDPMNTGGPGWT